MADIFDKVADNGGGDIFDQVSPEQPPKGRWEGFGRETLENLKRSYKESFGIIPSAASDVALGIPKAVTKKYFPKQVEGIFPEQTTGLGKVSRGAATALLPLAGASKVARAGTQALRHGAKYIPALRSYGIRKAAAGALTGAAIGGTYTEDLDKTLVERGVGAGVGLVMGGLTGAIPSIARGLKKSSKTKLKPNERISLLEQKSRVKYGKPINEAKLKKQRLNWAKQDTKVTVNERIRQSNLKMKKNIAQLDDDIQKAAEKGSVEFQEKLPKFFKSNSTEYGNRLDEISEALVNRKGVAITKGEVNDIIQNTLLEFQQTGVSQGQPNTYLNMLDNKYRLVEKMDDLGNVITDANTPIDFKQVVYDLRSVWKTISAQARQGKFTDNDIAASILKGKWGEWVSKFVPELQELNISYKPVITAMKESARIFKPAQGELATTQAENFLKKFGKSKLSGGQKKLLGMIEQGTEFAPGVGKISRSVEKLGVKRVTTIAKQELNRANLQQDLSNRLSQLEQQNRQLTETINQNKQFLQNRLQSLGTRKENVMKLMANRDKGRAIRKALLIGGGVAAVSTLPYSIKRLIQRLGGG